MRGTTPDIQYKPTQYALVATQMPSTTLPATGGPSLVLLAGALLVGGGLLLRIRRS